MKTLADAWQSYADDTLPIDAKEAEVAKIKRAFYAGALDAARLNPQQVVRECCDFALTIGRERAKS